MLFDYQNIVYFLLAFTRISGIMFLTPFFSSSAINMRVKVLFSAAVTFVVFSGIPKDISPEWTNNFYKFLMLIFKEALLGILIGYMLTFIFEAVQTASEAYSTTMGFNMMSVLDPMSEVQSPIIGQFTNLFFMLVFFMTGTHREILAVLINTFYKYPIGKIMYIPDAIVKQFIEAFNFSFLSAMLLALPLIGVLLLMDIVLGIMARIAPQMNVFFLGMPLKIMIGFYMLTTMVPYLYSFFKNLLESGIGKVMILISSAIFKN